MDRHEWGDVHLWISYIVIAAVIAHLGMNWTWLKKIAASMKPLRLMGGLLVGIVIIAVLLVLPVDNQRLPGNQGHRRIDETQEEWLMALFADAKCHNRIGSTSLERNLVLYPM